jgi:hypothetical protein
MAGAGWHGSQGPIRSGAPGSGEGRAGTLLRASTFWNARSHFLVIAVKGFAVPVKGFVVPVKELMNGSRVCREGGCFSRVSKLEKTRLKFCDYYSFMSYADFCTWVEAADECAPEMSFSESAVRG